MTSDKDQENVQSGQNSETLASRADRRRFVKIAAGSATVLYAAPRIAVAHKITALPFNQFLTVDEGQGTISGAINSVYTFAMSMTLDIDVQNVATITGFAANGAHVSGTNVGPITVVQSGPAVGTYVDPNVAVDVPIEYTDCGSTDLPAVAQFMGVYVATPPGMSPIMDFDLDFIQNGQVMPCPSDPNFTIVQIQSISAQMAHRS